MTTTRKPRRALMAELLLTSAPNTIRDMDEGKLSISFDTIAELREWLTAAGLDSPDLLIGEHDGTRADGQPYRSLNAYPTWHGWEILAHAMEHPAALTPLDTDTTDRLTALAEDA